MSTHRSSASRLPRQPLQIIATHWLSAALLVLALGAVLARDLLDSEALRLNLLQLHRQVGLLIWLLLFVRLVWLLRGDHLHPNAKDPAWERSVAALGHLALYGLLLAVPLLGWAFSDASGHRPMLFGLLHLPKLVPQDPDLADQIQEWHETAAWGLTALIAVHIAAAMWHHRIRKDAVLVAMLPWVHRRTPKPSAAPPHVSSPVADLDGQS